MFYGREVLNPDFCVLTSKNVCLPPIHRAVSVPGNCLNIETETSSVTQLRCFSTFATPDSPPLVLGLFLHLPAKETAQPKVICHVPSSQFTHRRGQFVFSCPYNVSIAILWEPDGMPWEPQHWLMQLWGPQSPPQNASLRISAPR